MMNGKPAGAMTLWQSARSRTRLACCLLALLVLVAAMSSCSSPGPGNVACNDPSFCNSALCCSAVASWFPKDAYFNKPIDDADTATVDCDPKELQDALELDFTTLDIYHAGEDSQPYSFDKVNSVFNMDATDTPAHDIPVSPSIAMPPNRAIGFESSQGMHCPFTPNGIEDCHYLVLDPANKQLIEIYHAEANASTKSFTVLANPNDDTDRGVVAVWELAKPYPANLRGDICSSADASGGLIAPLLFTAEEIVVAGRIDHALRLTLPNNRIRNRQYVRPATNGGRDGMYAQMNGIPYGARFRLKSSFDVAKSNLSPSAKIIATALKKYGMILSDGGPAALLGKADQFSSTKYPNDLNSNGIMSIPPTEFEMVNTVYGTDGENSCIRHQIVDNADTCVRNELF